MERWAGTLMDSVATMPKSWLRLAPHVNSAEVCAAIALSHNGRSAMRNHPNAMTLIDNTRRLWDEGFAVLSRMT